MGWVFRGECQHFLLSRLPLILTTVRNYGYLVSKGDNIFKNFSKLYIIMIDYIIVASLQLIVVLKVQQEFRTA